MQVLCRTGFKGLNRREGVIVAGFPDTAVGIADGIALVTSPVLWRLKRSRKRLGNKSMLSAQLEDSFHQQPFFAGAGLRQGLLKLPHQTFPFLNGRIISIGFRLLFE
jgi:hypothetical protein